MSSIPVNYVKGLHASLDDSEEAAAYLNAALEDRLGLRLAVETA